MASKQIDELAGKNISSLGYYPSEEGTNTEGIKNCLCVIRSQGVTSGATIYIQAYSEAGGFWFDIHEEIVTTDRTYPFTVGQYYSKLRANVSSYSDGLYDVVFLGQ